MKKISILIGTRPEAIKLAPVINELMKKNNFEVNICVTGQHKEMLTQALEIFKIVPHQDLGLMQPSQTLSGLTARLLESIDRYLKEVKPDLVLAQGDTTTVLSGALASFYNHIPFGHVEAGLRTYDIKSPWPEEANRVITASLTTLHFSPTKLAAENLIREGVTGENIHVVGNTVIDALINIASQVSEKSEQVQKEIPGEILNSHKEIVLITGHRRESFGEGLKNVCEGIQELATLFPSVLFVYPAHLNPEVQKSVKSTFTQGSENVFILPPLSYLSFVWLLKKSKIVVTDSGGIQEEAPGLGKPVLVTRGVTERPEGVEAGNALLVGTKKEVLIKSVTKLLTDQDFYASMAEAKNPYGDGFAAERIVKICEEFLYGNKR